MSMWTDPSPSDFDRWEQLLVEGEEPSTAAKKVGYTASAFRRANRDRHAEALAMSREARYGVVDERMERWTVADDAPPALRIAWAKRWNREYSERQQVEVTGAEGGPVVIEGGTSLAEVADLLAAVGALPGSGAAGGQVPAAGEILAQPS